MMNLEWLGQKATDTTTDDPDKCFRACRVSLNVRTLVRLDSFGKPELRSASKFFTPGYDNHLQTEVGVMGSMLERPWRSRTMRLSQLGGGR